MIDSGTALAVMGNHEFNAIAWAMPDPDNDGAYLRPRNPKNRHQHRAFLAEVGEDSALHKEWTDWFRRVACVSFLPFGRTIGLALCYEPGP